jgi:ankyrin repeat protein
MSEPDEASPELAATLFNLARAGQTDALAGHLDAGVPVGLANDAGDTLLMLAAYHGHAATVEALLDRGADPNQSNDKGQTPLAGAVFKGADAIARALLSAGADPSAGFPSAVEAARMFGRDELLELFELFEA